MTATDQTGRPAGAGNEAPAKQAALKLLEYCRANNWAGYDPYDALNSRLYRSVPVLNFRLARLAFTQGVKRCPINLRPVLLVPKVQNPKGLALFLSAVLKLTKLGLVQGKDLIWSLAERLEALRSPGYADWCWGYSFPWQTRTLLVKDGAPNLVSTVFVANAMLDLYREFGQRRHLKLAVSAADYLLKELYWVGGESAAGFRYPSPQFKAPVHNANLLGAALLCRVVRESGEVRFAAPALRAARHSVRQQREDGSWDYGEASTQRWVDNFHTGYNLCALKEIATYAETDEFAGAIKWGLEFYRTHFFREDGAPAYFHDRSGPLDVHSAAQSIITLVRLKRVCVDNLRLARLVLNWTLANLWNAGGYFSYQQRWWGTIRIPYMRWSQAWMLLALAIFLQEGSDVIEAENLKQFTPLAEAAL